MCSLQDGRQILGSCGTSRESGNEHIRPCLQSSCEAGSTLLPCAPLRTFVRTSCPAPYDCTASKRSSGIPGAQCKTHEIRPTRGLRPRGNPAILVVLAALCTQAAAIPDRLDRQSLEPDEDRRIEWSAGLRAPIGGIRPRPNWQNRWRRFMIWIRGNGEHRVAAMAN